MKCFCLFLMLMNCTVAVAQSEKIEADRPDQSDGAASIKPAHIQVETALHTDIFRHESDNTFLSSTTIRYGLLKKLEARLVVEQGYHRDRHIEAADGQYPIALGGKLNLLEDHPSLPDVAILAHIQLPVTNGKKPWLWSPAFTLVGEKKLADLTLTTNIGMRQAAFEKAWAWQMSFDSKYALLKKMDVFAEYFAQFASHEMPSHNIDGGLLFHVRTYLMLHLAAGTNMLHDGKQYFINTGFAIHI